MCLLPSYTSPSQSCLLLNEGTSYLLEMRSDGLTLSSSDSHPLFELKESILLAQGTLDDAQQIHLAYIKASGDFCYSVILPTGHHQTMSLGRLDIRTQRFDRLLLFPAGKEIHIFYASSHYGLPDVWRITHLFWNGQTWKSALLGEVVHPRYPLYHVLMDSRSNLHVLMMTFLGSRSVLLASMFNGTFYLWSKRQEVLTIPREVVDMTAVITPQDEGHLFWAAKQPASDRFEIGHGIQSKLNDFKSTWRIDAPPATNLEGPLKGLGAIESQGILNLLVNINQAVLFQVQERSWKPVLAHSGDFFSLHIAQKAERTTTYTHWLGIAGQEAPLFAQELSLVRTSSLNGTPQVSVHQDNSLQVAPHGKNLPQTTTDGIDAQAISGQGNSLACTAQAPPPTTSEQTNPQETSNDSSSSRHLSLIFSDLKESTTHITSNLEYLSEKVNSLPEVLELLKELKTKNDQTLNTLQQLETQVHHIQTQREVAAKKGFWQRWLT
ncbi:hypothetical protein [Desulfitobacterium dehalogenans]|uniref:hypothetical protein n=1 Tax=Desulfitobacterium dehalogenans TaxID=36854 RepID=UPI001FA7210E|nr:hypothetical protein [Desulfitobacterium dehalogenans]